LSSSTGPPAHACRYGARAALSDWLLAGGALALSLDRPEDLRAPYLQAWAGGPVDEDKPERELREEAVFAQPLDPGGAAMGRGAGGIAELRVTPSDASARLPWR
jgi:hypothetical protein